MTKVAEIISNHCFCVSPSDPIENVARVMQDHNLEVVPVCENGRWRGMITAKQIISLILTSGHNLKRELAASITTDNMPKASSGLDIVDAAKIMASHRVEYLPVVQNGKFVGLLTLDDLARESLAAAAVVLARCAETEQVKQPVAPIN